MTTRKEAIAACQTTYNTGKPCIYGHLGDRYALNGACVQCMKANSNRQHQVRAAVTSPIKQAREQLVEMGVRVYHTDIGPLFDACVAVTLARYPMLSRGDVIGKASPTAVTCGTGWYKLRVHPDDCTMLREVAQVYFRAHTVNIDFFPVQARLAELQKQAERRDTGAGEWTYK